jgi:hypothetical protein
MSDPINRLYDTVFHRDPDAGGYAFWTDLAAHGTSLHDIAAAFVTAPEFSTTYGAPSNEAFVESLYANTLHRHSDPGGLAAWSGALNLGLLDRAAVVVGFSESAEHIGNMDHPAPAAGPQPLPSRFPGGHPIIGTKGWLVDGTPGNDVIVATPYDDSIVGGRGNDIITGNGGDDIFRFSVGDGDDRITDYHRGNQIEIHGPPGTHANLIRGHSAPNHPGEMAGGEGPYAIVYDAPARASHPNDHFQGDVQLDGITPADVPWVQASIHIVIG